MKAQIPNRLEELLNKEQGLYGAVLQFLASFGRWVPQNRLDFFPEYIDHGPAHVENVMRTQRG